MLKYMPLLASVSLLSACGAPEKPLAAAPMSYNANRVSAAFLKGVSQHITPYDQPNAVIKNGTIEVAQGATNAKLAVVMHKDHVDVTTVTKAKGEAPSKVTMKFKIEGRRVFPASENSEHICNHPHPRDKVGTLNHPTTQRDVTVLMAKAFRT